MYGEDVYKDEGSFEVSIKEVMGGVNNLDISSKAIVEVKDTEGILDIKLSGDTKVVEGKDATYKVSLTDANGAVKAIEDMTVSFKYTYTTASGEDIVAVENVTIKAGQSEASFSVTAVDDVYKEGSESYSVAIDKATGTSNYEKIAIDQTAVTTTITDYSDPTNPDVSEDDTLNINLVASGIQKEYKTEEIGRGTGSKITSLEDGGYVVTWRGTDKEADNSIFVQQFDANGAAVGITTQLEALNNTKGNDEESEITSLQDGGYVVTWFGKDSSNDWSIFVQQFKSDGNKVGTTVQLEALNNTTGTDYSPRITTLEDGGYVVTWYGKDSEGDYSIFVQQFKSDGTLLGATTQLEALNNTTGSDSSPRITTLKDGSYVVTWQGVDSDGDSSIFVQQFNSDGTLFGITTQLEALNKTNGEDWGSQITSLKDGGYVVSWSGKDSEGDYSIFVQQFKSDGSKVNTTTQLEALNNTTSSDREAKIISLKDGGYVVSWSGVDKEGDFSIFVQQFSNDGSKVGTTIQLEALNTTVKKDLEPQITSLKDGGYVVTWYGEDSDNNSDYSIFVQQFSATGTKVGETVQLEALNTTIGWDKHPNITTLKDGSYVVTWEGVNKQGFWSIFKQQFNADGSRVVEIGATITESETATYQITLTDDDGNAVKAAKDMVVTFKYTYSTASSEDITEVKTVTVKAGESTANIDIKAIDDVYKENTEKFYIEIVDVTNIDQYEKTAIDDIPVETIINDDTPPDNVNINLVASGTQGEYETKEIAVGLDQKIIGLKDGGYVVTWYGVDKEGDYSIFVQQYDAKGVVVGAVTKLEAPNNTVGKDYYPQIGILEDGGYVVTWSGYDSTNDEAIFVQQFDAKGALSGTTTQLEALNNPIGDDYDSKIIGLKDGGYVVTWQGADSDGDSSIFVQQFNSDGTLFGITTQLEALNKTDGEEWGSQITSLKDGGYVVTWSGDDSGNDWSIFVQQFKADGSKVGTTTKLEALNNTDGEDWGSQITSLKDGGYVVTWQGEDKDEDVSIFVQQFKSDGTLAGATVQLEALDNTTGYDYKAKIISLKDGGYVVTWQGEDKEGDNSIFVQQFKADGSKVGKTTQLEALNNTTGKDYFPEIISLKDGGYVVSWYGIDSEGDYSIFVQQFKSDGTLFGTTTQLEAPNNNKGTDYGVALASLEDGGYLVSWRGDNGKGTRLIHIQQFNADGSKTEKVEVGASISEVETAKYQITLTDDNGKAVIAKEDMVVTLKYTYSTASSDDIVETKTVTVKAGQSTANIDIKAIDDIYKEAVESFYIEIADVTNKEQFEKTTVDDMPVKTTITDDNQGDNINVNLVASGETKEHKMKDLGLGESPQITYLEDGGYVVTWSGKDSDGDTSIFVQQFNSEGVKVGAVAQLEALNNTTRSDFFPQVTFLKDGGYAVTWIGTDKEGDNSIFVQQFNSDGILFGVTTQLEALNNKVGGDFSPEIIGLKDGGYAVTWYGTDKDGDYSIFVQQFGGDGTLVGTVTQLEALNHTTGEDKKPQIAALEDGGYAVTWYGADSDKDWSIFIQKFNSDGTLAGATTQLEALNNTAGSDYLPQIASLKGGGYVVVWYGMDSQKDNSIFVQQFNSNGTPSGKTVQLEALNNTTGGDFSPQVTSLKDGGYVVTWQGKDSDGDYSIFVQQFKSDGTLVGTTIQLEALNNTTNNDSSAQVIELKDGGYVVTWQGVDKEGDTSIFVQQFSATGAKVSETVQLEALNDTTGNDAIPQITPLKDGGYAVTWEGTNSQGSKAIYVQQFNANGRVKEDIEIGATITEGENATYKITLTDDDGNPIVTKTTMLVALKYTYITADGDDIVETKIVTVKEGQSEATINIASLDDVYKENAEKFLVEIAGVQEQFENTTIDSTPVETTIIDDTTFDNVNIKLLLDDSNNLIIKKTFATDEVVKNTYNNLETLAFEDGSYVVTWVDLGYSGISGQKYNLDGSTNGSVFKISSLIDNMHTKLALLGDTGKYVAVFQAYTPPARINPNRSVFVQIVDEDGTTNGNPIELEGVAGYLDGKPQVQVLDNSGKFIVTWISAPQGNNNHNLYSQRFNADGTKDGDMVTIAKGTTDQGFIESFDDGSYAVAWTNVDKEGDFSVFVQKFSAEGTKLTAQPIILEGTNTTAPSYARTDDSQKIIKYGDNGEFMVVFRGKSVDGSMAVYIQKFNSDGTTAGNQIEIKSVSGYSNPAISEISNDGSFVVSYQSVKVSNDDSLTIQKFNADGTTTAAPVVLDNKGLIEAEAQILTLLDGSFVVVWNGWNVNNTSDIFLQKFNSDGTKQGETEKLSKDAGVYHGGQELTLLSNGGYVVTWGRHDGNGISTLFKQQYGADGSKTLSTIALGEEGKITYNITLTDDNGNPIVAKEDMEVTLKYTYLGASSEDITEVKTVIVKKGSSEISFDVNAVDDTYKEDDENFSISILSVKNAEQFEKATIDNTSIEAIIQDDSSSKDNLNVKLVGAKTGIIEGQSAIYKVTLTDDNGNSVIAPKDTKVSVKYTYKGSTTNEDIVEIKEVVVLKGSSEAMLVVESVNDNYIVETNSTGNVTLVNVGHTNGSQTAPVITKLSNGDVLYVWGDNFVSSKNLLKGKIYDSFGRVKVDTFTVSDKSASRLDGEYWITKGLDIKELANGNIAIAYASYGSGYQEPIMTVINPNKGSSDAGFFVNKDISIQQNDTTNHESAPILTVLANGNLLAVYAKEVATNNSTVYGRIFDTSGKALTSEFRVGSGNVETTTYGNNRQNIYVEELSSGKVVIGIANELSKGGYKPVLNILDLNEDLTSTKFKVASDIEVQGKENPGNESAPMIVEIDGGKFMTIWYGGASSDNSGSSRKLYARVFNEDGTAATDQYILTQNSIDGWGAINIPLLSLDTLSNGNIALGWVRNSDNGTDAPMIAIIDSSSGTVISRSEIKINTSTATGSLAGPPIIKALGDGNFVAVWHDQANVDTAVYYRIFDKGGSPISAQIRVNPTGINTLMDSRDNLPWDSLNVEVTDDNSFIIGWIGNDANSLDGSGTSVLSVKVDLGKDEGKNSFEVSIDKVVEGANEYENVVVDSSKVATTISEPDNLYPKGMLVNNEKQSKSLIDANSELNTSIKDGIANFKEAGEIDLSNLKNISEINIDNGKENKLSLTLKDVLDIKAEGSSIKIFGDKLDKVMFKNEEGKEWEKKDTIIEDNKTFDIYSNSGDPTLQVKVEQQITDGITS